MSSEAREAYIEYGPAIEGFVSKSELRRLAPNQPVEFSLGELARDTEFQYRLCLGKPGATTHPIARMGTFRTQRGRNEGFTFEIESDAPFVQGAAIDPILRARSIRAAIADRPDFLVALDSPDATLDSVRHQRRFLGLIGRTAPVLFVGAPKESSRFFFPSLDGKFYKGDVGSFVAANRDFAWNWGPAQFVVFDPAKSSFGDRRRKWIKRTLRASHAQFKFAFTQTHPGKADVHELMARDGVAILFEGRDRFFVKDAHGAIVMHDMPTGEPDSIAGRTRVHVSPAQVRVEYVRVRSDQQASSEIAYAMNLPADQPAR